jgi:hypothetical protein
MQADDDREGASSRRAGEPADETNRIARWKGHFLESARRACSKDERQKNDGKHTNEMAGHPEPLRYEMDQ